jgi:drug/metabolite transporter (DMT)-like permease
MGSRRLVSAGISGATGAAAGLPSPVVWLGLVVLNQVFNAGATVAFAWSGLAGGIRPFILWQIGGGLFGLGAQLTFAGLVRVGSLRVANAIGIGLAFAVAQLAGAILVFGEPFGRAAWLGTLLVVAGVLLITFGR